MLLGCYTVEQLQKCDEHKVQWNGIEEDGDFSPYFYS